MLSWALAVPAGAVATWWFTRWRSRGKPFPVWAAALFDNRLVGSLSGGQTLVRRSDVRPGMRVLDAGCGPGRLTIPLARAVGSGGHVIALDLQEGMLSRLRDNAQRAGLTNIRTIVSPLATDVTALAGERASFDRAFLVTVLGEIPDPSDALRAIHATLKPNGILSITETIIDPDYIPRARLLKLGVDAGYEVVGARGSPLAYTVHLRPSALKEGQ